MNIDKLSMILLAVFLLLFGLFTVTNVQVEWGRPIMGFSALVAGVVIMFRALR